MNVDGVILAAGYSSRANAFKMELRINEKSILQRCVESMYDQCDKIIVVSGYKHEKINKLMEDYLKVQVVYNEEFNKGMFSSVKKGIRNVTSDRFLLTPGDYPLIDKKIIKRILEVNGKVVIPSFEKKAGHPILLDSSLINEILAENEDSSLKSYLNKKEKIYIDMPNNGVLLDVDTFEDYNNIKKYLDVID